MGANASPIGELTFENFQVSTENLLGKEGDGFKVCMWQLNQTRLNCAGGALGVARAAREAAVNYCNQREQFGQKIGQYQMNQELIAQMVVQEEAARLLVYRAAWLADQGKPNNLETSIAKYTAAEAAAHATDAAMKILGAYGYSTEFPVERYYRDAKSYQIVEGSSNIQKDDHRPGRTGVPEGESLAVYSQGWTDEQLRLFSGRIRFNANPDAIYVFDCLLGQHFFR